MGGIAHLIGGDAARVDADHAPGARRHARIVGDEHDGPASTIEALKEIENIEGGLRIEIARGLIGQDQLRLVDESAGNGDTLLLAARKFAWRMVHALREPTAVRARRPAPAGGSFSA